MGTRRWFVELERWMWKHKMSREDVARRSGHDFGHVLELFDQDDPNPTLRFYLDLLEAAGARMDTANGNSVEHVVTRLGELRKRADLTVAELARRSGMRRPHLSGIINGSRANMQLAVFDVLVTVLGAEEEMMLVDRWHLSQEVLLALAAGDETVAAGDGSSKPHLHVVSNSARQAGAGEAPRVTSSHSAGTASAAAPQGPPDDDEQRAAEKKARAEQAKARAAAKAEAERSLAAARTAWAEQERAERAEYERVRAEERAREERAAQERRAQEQARAEAAARAVAAAAAAAAARAVLQNKVMVGAGIVLAIAGGVCIAKGVAGLRSNAA